ncbi:MAG: hypothetical protein DRJ64_05305, partial [Thermoprotei archaeon]
NEIETEGHDYAKLAGRIILDPINLTPLGLASKGSKGARIAKSVGAGLPIGYATMSAKNFGNDDLTDKQKTDQNVLSAGLVGVLNGAISVFTKGKVNNAFRSGGDVVASVKSGRGEASAVLETMRNNPEVLGLSPKEAKKYVDEFEEVIAREMGETGVVSFLIDYLKMLRVDQAHYL